MDNATILAVAILAAVLVYFLVFRKPNPPAPPHPVENMCVVNYHSIKENILEKTDAMTKFFINFMNTYGNNISGDPIVTILYNIYDQVASSLPTTHHCNVYTALKPLILSLLKISDSTLSGYVSPNLPIMFNGKHVKEAETYRLYINFFKTIIVKIDTESSVCCLKH